jgi:polyribonucleotide nucleotidyltransferase
MALFPQLEAVRTRLNGKLSLTDKEKALLSEINEVDKQLVREDIVEGSVRLIKMTGPDDGRCGCCGR